MAFLKSDLKKFVNMYYPGEHVKMRHTMHFTGRSETVEEMCEIVCISRNVVKLRTVDRECEQIEFCMPFYDFYTNMILFKKATIPSIRIA